MFVMKDYGKSRHVMYNIALNKKFISMNTECMTIWNAYCKKDRYTAFNN